MKGKGQSSLKWLGWTGLSIIGISEGLLFSGVPFVLIYFTPLVWTGYIFFVDSLVYRSKGTSLIFNRPAEFVIMLPLSVGFWLVFEFYNLYIKNWHYIGLPEDLFLRWIGYAWAFATIWPAILETAEALENSLFIGQQKIKPLPIKNRLLIGSHPETPSPLAGEGRGEGDENRKHKYSGPLSPPPCPSPIKGEGKTWVPGWILIGSLGFGSFCLILPLLVSAGLAQYLAAPVWLGFIFFLEPLNYWLKGKSLLRDWERGNPQVLYTLLISGFICGGLWEFWNYWAGAKWHYTVPILSDVKIFEMPILGYFGFPPFAVECYVMYAFIGNIFARKSNS